MAISAPRAAGALLFTGRLPAFPLTVSAAARRGIGRSAVDGTRHCENQYMVAGLMRMAPVAIMLLGTGTLAGIIANSGKDVLIHGLTTSGLPSAAGARVWRHVNGDGLNHTAGTAVASGVFSPALRPNLAFPPGGEPRYDPCGRHGAGPSPAARQLFHATGDSVNIY